MSLKSLKYDSGSNTLEVLDQLKLPHEKAYIPIQNCEDGWKVIRSMQVRGAPLIALVAVVSLAVEVRKMKNELLKQSDKQVVLDYLLTKMDYLRTSRPTAVNLFRATDQLKEAITSESAKGLSSESLIALYVNGAELMLDEDVKANMAIGEFGANRILEITGLDKVKVLTICNTGSLATAGYGTALGVVRSLHSKGCLSHVYACETRPYNQGARLTAFEITEDELPGTLICDSMAAYLMATKGVDCVVVGADRVTSNGDTANKIGTYQLAIIAKYHNVPFFTAVPTTTLDLSMSSGAEIHIEERPAEEMTTIFGQRIAPVGINTWNPSFDVTPHNLIRGVITEIGVAESSTADGIIDIPDFMRKKGHMLDKVATSAQPTAVPSGFTKFDEVSIKGYVAHIPKLRHLMGLTKPSSTLGISDEADMAKMLTVKEIGDGNLNFVYLISGPTNKKIIVKQALPYIRCIGEAWPLTLERAAFETAALREQHQLCPNNVPEVYHFDKKNALIAMYFVPEPHLILRKAFITGVKISSFADHLSTFLANTLFGTSALNMEGGQLRLKVASWSRNTAMCALTEKVVFTDPYCEAEMNRHTTPQLDSYAEAIRSDSQLKVAANALKEKFLSHTQALIHADLHTGSVMACEGSTFVIDPEFAFYGPMGFDVGALLSNMLFAYFSQIGLRSGSESEGSRAAYAAYILEEMVKMYKLFEDKFLSLWNSRRATSGDFELYKNGMFSGNSFQKVRNQYTPTRPCPVELSLQRH